MNYGHAVIARNLASLELEPARPPIYDRDIGARTLFEDPATGAEHFLIRYPAGLVSKLHRHTAAHTVVVLEGQLEVNGHVIGPGSYCHFPAGEPMHHAPVGDEPCLMVFVFDGRQDMEPLE
jgi:quercetin dioxygenase-like cupin family protein